MTPDQAIAYLEAVTGLLRMTRAEHIKVQTALDVLRTLSDSEKARRDAAKKAEPKPLDNNEKAMS